MSQEIVYDLAKPYHLFSANYGLVLRNRKKDIKVLNDYLAEKSSQNTTFTSVNTVENYLFTLMVEPDNPSAPYYRFIDTENILEDYVMSISSKVDTIKESEICNYFYYLGKLIGQFAFMLSFKKNIYFTEPHLKERFSKLKSSIVILINSFPQMAQKIQEYLADDNTNEDYKEILQKSRLFLEPSFEFVDILDSIDYFTSGNDSEVPISTVFALNYIGLSYLLFGMLPRLIVPGSNISMKDFFNKCSADVIESTLDNLIINQEDEGIINKYKVYALLYTFKKITDFYMNDNVFKNNTDKNIIINALYNLGKYVEKYTEDEKTTEGKDIIVEIAVNTIFNIKPNVKDFTDMSLWIKPEVPIYGLESDCDSPIVYFKTLNLFLLNSYSSDNDSFKPSVYQNMYELLDKTNTVSIAELKLFVEKMIVEESKVISPKNIFKLLYIAGYARQSKEKYAYDLVVMAEVAVYNMLQEWFNRRTKIYSFEPRSYTFPEAYGSDIYKQLKYECLTSVFEYMKMVFSECDKYSSYIPLINTIDLVRSMHYDLLALNTISTPESVINSVSLTLSALDDNNYGIDNMIQIENAHIGIMYLILRYPIDDIINKIITLHLPLTDFFRDFEENNESANELRDYVLDLSPNTEIVGSQSDSWIYKVVNTNNYAIMNSPLTNIQKFYLSYCLNYQFVKSYQAEMFTNVKPLKNVIICDKDKVLDEDRQIVASLESQYKLLFGNYTRSKPNNFGKYGLPL